MLLTVTEPMQTGKRWILFNPISKKIGGVKPIVDFRDLTEYVAKEKFKMAILETIETLLEEGNFLWALQMPCARTG